MPQDGAVLPTYPLPPRPRHDWLAPVLSALLILAVALTVSGGATAVAATKGGGSAIRATFVGDLRPQVRNAGLRALLDRRAKAVRDHDRQAFLADVDTTDPVFARQQEEEYDNLTKLPLAEFRYDIEEAVQYDSLVPPAIRSRYRSAVRAPGVTVRYRIDGMDTEPVAAPWVPVFGVSRGTWRLAGLAQDPKLPTGTNGQAWQTGPITVVRSERVVLVLSAGDAGRAPDMLRMAEAGLDHVAEVRRGGWAGKVLITAVQDARLFTTYFTDSPDRIDNFAAIAVPYYASVPEWSSKPRYAATRVVFNPKEFSADPTELAHDLTHEFVHTAMGPVTTEDTPLWLVEGFAEYVAYKPERVSGLFAKRALDGYPTGAAPPSGNFYADGRNYMLGWLACRMIAQRYGEAKLVALYDAFQTRSSAAEEIRRVLGVDQATLNGQYVDYVEKARAGSLP
jgi:hypothetical protein